MFKVQKHFMQLETKKRTLILEKLNKSLKNNKNRKYL